MILAVFSKETLEPVCLINEYTYCQYTLEYCGRGKFEIHIQTTEPSLEYLVFGNFIYLDVINYKDTNSISRRHVFGLIKNVRNSETSDFEVIVTGYLSNNILEYRSFLLTAKYTGKPYTIANRMFLDLFLLSSDQRRWISGIGFWTNIQQEVYDLPLDNIVYQNTGDDLLKVFNDLLLQYNIGFYLQCRVFTPSASGAQGMKINYLDLYFTTPTDRSVGNEKGNDPVIFSFDLDNVSKLDYELNGSDYRSVAIVASEGVGTERKTLEVGDLEASGFDRIELYVDARDLQSDPEYTEDYVDEQFGELLDGEY